MTRLTASISFLGALVGTLVFVGGCSGAERESEPESDAELSGQDVEALSFKRLTFDGQMRATRIENGEYPMKDHRLAAFWTADVRVTVYMAEHGGAKWLGLGLPHTISGSRFPTPQKAITELFWGEAEGLTVYSAPKALARQPFSPNALYDAGLLERDCNEEADIASSLWFSKHPFPSELGIGEGRDLRIWEGHPGIGANFGPASTEADAPLLMRLFADNPASSADDATVALFSWRADLVCGLNKGKNEHYYVRFEFDFAKPL